MKQTAILLTAMVFFFNIENGFSQNKTIYEVTATEVIQVSSYTYLLVKGKNTKMWLVVPKFEAKVGEKYYYKGGMLMSNFNSKELNRTFENVLFLENISPSKIDLEIKTYKHNSKNNNSKKDTNKKLKKISEKIPPISNGISISELLKNKHLYKGKTVIIKGKVTKYTPKIMYKNWFHLQDGTEYNDVFEITVTTNAQLKVGDIVTVKGTITLNKDFGYGYLYKIILENAVIIE
ncbi:MAG: hypothetical protein L3J09_06465 [Flavobacteriaceae bacterium]|nr:hypothetical protein [Flavobacteriaceae bacterium]